eukprot:14441304-Heterocapsa_arctica.AAC.1
METVMDEAETSDEAGNSHEHGAMDAAGGQVQRGETQAGAPAAHDARDDLIPSQLSGIYVGAEAMQRREERR